MSVEIFKKFSFVALALIILAGTAILINKEFLGGGVGTVTVLDSQTTAGVSGKEPAIPQGRQEYQVIQAAGRWPKILEAVIDPPDVHIGDVQRLEIVVQSQEPIASVEAQIETDNDTVVLPLELVGEVSETELLPQRYAVLGDGTVAVLETPDNRDASGKTSIARAQEESMVSSEPLGGLPKIKYAGEWTVRDTHDRYYHTTFVVRDAAGNENSITLAWSDACGIPQGGDWMMSVSCTISSTDGVDNGNVTLSSGTLTLNATFAFNSGKSITLSGGTIALGAGGEIKQTNLWGTDGDGDNYLAIGFSQLAQDTEPAGYSRRWSSGTGDCDDGNGSVWQYLTGYRDADLDTYTVGGATSVCSGSSLPSGWRSSQGATGSAANPDDCNDGNSSLFYAWVGGTNEWYDNDADTYGDPSTPSTVQHCGTTSVPAGMATNSNDCYDSNANARPGQTNYFAPPRGDGSFDYDCDGSVTLIYTSDPRGNGDCLPADDSLCDNVCPGACRTRIPGNRIDGEGVGLACPEYGTSVTAPSGAGECYPYWKSKAPDEGGPGNSVIGCYACDYWALQQTYSR